MRAALTVFLLMLCGCSSPGRVLVMDVELQDGGAMTYGDIEFTGPARISAGDSVQPTPPQSSASAEASLKGGASGSSGDAAASSFALDALGGRSFWAGLGLLIVGAFIWLSKRAGVATILAPGPTGPIMRAMAVVPKGAGLVLMGLGAGLIILPFVLETLAPIIQMAAVLAVIFFACKWALNLWGEYDRDDKEGDE